MNHIIKNQQTYDILASEYEQKSQVRNDFNKLAIEGFFMRHMKEGGKILDIGCAVGVDIAILKENGFEVKGMDISEEMISFSKKRNPGIEHFCGNFMDLEINEKFDGIFAQAFIHLFPVDEVEKILQKMKDILNEDGIVYITTTKSETSEEGWYEKKDYSGLQKRYRKHWRKDELKEMLEKYFEFKDYIEFTDPYGKIFMDFVVSK